MGTLALANKAIFVYGTLLVTLLGIIFLNILLYNDTVRSAILGPNSVGLTPNSPYGGSNLTNRTSTRRHVLNPAKLKPGMTFFGASIDWQAGDTPYKFYKRFGKPMAVVQYFMEISSEVALANDIKYVVDEVIKMDGTVLSLTVQPLKGLDAVTPAALDQLARMCKVINDYGVPVLLRWAHEMNGNWYTYGQQPSAYRESYIKVAKAIRSRASLTYMVWAPNNPTGYPWGGPKSLTPALLNELDTNRDGKLSELDDPYTPYYPGDEYVDWVGYSIFYFGEAARNSLPTSVDRLMNYVPAENPQVSWNLYRDFAQLRNKPFGIMETAAAYYPDNARAGDPTELQIKQTWWSQLYSAAVLDKYPLMKLILWFDIAKVEQYVDTNGLAKATMHDFRLSWDRTIAKSFLQSLPQDRVFFADVSDQQLASITS